jgi:hypothetical protein
MIKLLPSPVKSLQRTIEKSGVIMDNIEVLLEITISQKMKDPVLEALEHAGIEPDFVHVGVGEVTIEISEASYENALDVVESVLLTGF